VFDHRALAPCVHGVSFFRPHYALSRQVSSETKLQPCPLPTVMPAASFTSSVPAMAVMRPARVCTQVDEHKQLTSPRARG